MQTTTIYFHDELKIVFRRQIHEMAMLVLLNTAQELHHLVRDHPFAAAMITTN